MSIYKYGKKSSLIIASCHIDLQNLFREVLKYFDHSCICGYRNEKEQNEAFNAKPPRSTKKFPDSKHNKYPSLAIDVAPYPIDWNDIRRFDYFAGYVKGIAKMLKNEGIISHDIRWGGDWNNNTILKDNKLNDLVHYELIML